MAEHEQISINDLRSEQIQPNMQGNEFIDPNLELQNDANNEKKVVSASDIGLPKREKEVDKNDIQNAYDILDRYIERKQDEVRRFNEAMDQNGGEISELEWRAKNGEAPTSVMVDEIPQDIAESGDIERFEDNLNAKNPNVNEDTNTSKIIEPEEDSELAQLEREAEAYNTSIEQQNNAVVAEEKTETKISTPISIKEPEPQITVAHNAPDFVPITEGSPVTKVTEKKYVASKDKLDYTPSTMESGAIKIDAAPMKSDFDDIDKEINKLMDEDTDIATKDSSDDLDEYGDKIKEKLKEKLGSNVISINNFKIATNKPITSNNVLSIRQSEATSQFKWVLYHTGIPFTMKKFYGYELDELRDNINSQTNPRAIFKLMYDHIVEGGGNDFIEWTKSINRLDINNLWMGVYGACFQFSNYLPYDCDKCKNVTITDGTKIREMVKFKTPEIEAKFNEIMSMDCSNPDFGSTHGAAIVPISNTIAIGIKEPSIYDTVIEPTLLNDAFSEKYNDVIRYLPFIDNVYFIDTATCELKPVAHAEVPRNEAKTLKFKILEWAKIFRTFNSDEQGILLNAIANMSDDKLDEVQYCVPAITCDSCGAEIPESIMGAADLVFIRHRLTLFGAV